MEDISGYRVRAFVVIAFAGAVLLGGPAVPDPENPREPGLWRGTDKATVETSGGSTVDILMESATLRYSYGADGGEGGREWPCELSVLRVEGLDWTDMLDSHVPDSLPVEVRCGESALVETLWVPIPELVDGIAVAEVERYVESVLAPGLSMGTSPPANVLVGLSTWFWIEGWDGEVIAVPVVAPWGATVMVEMSLGEVRWDFGDGSAKVIGDLGLAYPQESTVQHVYTHRSTSRDEPDGAYEVTASIRIDARYWYEGSGPFSVAPLVQDHSQPVIVRQVQAVLG